ncbi:MAG: glycosyltransferase family 39 protein [Cyclobacteriaceae bacterium]|nr:glycosyltransferase family 39 protein [Cyclobacteriaceae bacterium]
MMKIDKEKLDKLQEFALSNKFHYLLIVIGVILRLRQYLFNRDFWVDEAMLATNLENRGFIDLLKPLDFIQIAPMGFLYLQKITIELFGYDERIYRLWPLLFGILSMFFFYKLLQKLANPVVTTISLAIFVFSYKLIYYSSELKQYSLELMVAIIFYFLILDEKITQFSSKRLLWIGLYGAIAVWFSFSIVFVMVTVGLWILFELIRQKQFSVWYRYLPMGLMWLVSFVIYYFTIIIHYKENQLLQIRYWTIENKWMPLNFTTSSDFLWFFDVLGEYFIHVAGAWNVEALYAFFILFACVFYIFHKQYHHLVFIIIIPLFMLLSALKVIPFAGRVLLFTSAGSIILLVSGLYFLSDVRDRFKKPIFILLVSLVLFQPFMISAFQFIRPNVEEEIKPTLEYVIKFAKPDDVLYVSYFSTPTFDYYLKDFPELNQYKIVYGEDVPRRYLISDNDLHSIDGNSRVWIISVNDDNHKLAEILQVYGEEINRYNYRGGRVFLFDFKNSVF